MLNLSKTVRDLRARCRYTQEQLAEACGVSRQAVTKWENGTSLPDVEKVVQLSKLFGVSADELLTGKKPAARGRQSAQKSAFDENEKTVNRALRTAMSYRDPEEEIARFLSGIGEKTGCDRMYIFEPNQDGSYKNTYEWCGRGIAPQTGFRQNVPPEDLTPWLERFSRGEYIFIGDVDEIADSEPEVWRRLKQQDVRSLLACPLFGGRSFLGADNPAPAFINRTSSLMEIMAHFVETMLERRDLMRELKWANVQNEQISRLNRGVRYQLNAATGQLSYDREQAKALGYALRAETLAQLEAEAEAHPEFRDHLMIDGIGRALQTKENSSIDFVSYKTDREIRWNRLTISPFLDGSGNVLHLCGILQDLSGGRRFVKQYNRYISNLPGGLHICYLSRPAHLEYASDGLCAFLGYTRGEFDRLAGGVYTNVIAEEDRPVFAACAGRLAQGPGTESCEYRMVRKDGSLVQVVDTMESVLDGSGILYGYAYVLEKSQVRTMLEMAEENERRQMAVIDRQFEVLEALSEDYLNVFRIRLDEDLAEIVRLNGYVTKGMNRDSAEPIPYYRFCRQYIQDRVYPEDRQKMLTAMHPDTVRKAFAADDEYLVVYRAAEEGVPHYCQMKYIRLKDSQNPDRISFIAGFKNIDRVIEQERRQKKQLEAACRDVLTGVMNRNAYERDLPLLNSCRSAGILFCSVNGLKAANDRHGRVKGDRLLKDFADLMKQHFSADCIYRIGGDEFVCMIGNIGEEGFKKRAEEFAAAAEQNGGIAAVGAAWGVPKGKETLIREAEVRMCEMKSRQKSGCGSV